MTHQRPSSQPMDHSTLQTPQQHRPPYDVEEALSSMLWTPYERTPTDSSSDDDDDERLNKKLRRSQSSFDYRSLPTTLRMPLEGSTYFGTGDETMFHAASSSRISSSAASSHTKRSSPPLQTSSPIITPFVPFTDLLYNQHNNNNRCSQTSDINAATTTIATVALIQRATTPLPSPSPTLVNYQFHQHHHNYKGNHGSSVNVAYNYRFSYPYYGHISSLHKWWSTSGRVSNTTAATATTSTKEPPPYDSLYAVHSMSVSHRENNAVLANSQTVPHDASITTSDPNEQDKENKDSLCDNHAKRSTDNVSNSQFMKKQQQQTSPLSRTPSHSSNNNTQNECDIFDNKHELKKKEQQNNNDSGNLNRSEQPKFSSAVLCETQNTFTIDQTLRGQTWHWSNPYYGCEETEVYATHASSQQTTFSLANQVATAFTTDSLIPNKCLAELERLYAEFRASESLIERQLNTSYESNKEIPKTQCDKSGHKMRLNIPASNAIKSNETQKSATVTATSTNSTSTTSTVFLTTTNSVTTNNVGSSSFNNNNNNIIGNTNNINKLQLGLTIKVNENDKNSIAQQQQQQDQFIVNNNGVSVINCNYNNTNNNNNNENENSSHGNNNCDQDNNNFVASNVINSVSVNSNSSNSSVPPNSIKNVNNKIISSVCKSNVDHVENFVNNNRKINRSTTTNTCKHTTSTNVDSVRVINVNNISVHTPNSNHSTTITATSPKTPTTSSPTSVTNTPTHRTFTSTECQTDDILPAAATTAATATATSPNRVQHINERPRSSPQHVEANLTTNSREQRRRERRERRQQQQMAQQHQQASSPNLLPSMHAARRHLGERYSLPSSAMPQAMTHLHPPHLHHASSANATMPAAMSAMLRPMLPDLLHSHFPPPYSALQLPPTVNGPMNVSLMSPPTPSLLGHSPNGPTANAITMQPPPPGSTILTPVISTVPLPGATPILSGDGRFTLPLPIIRRSPSERSGKGCCGQWFAGPPLRALIAVVALGGVACALGGAALGATGLAGPPSSHLTAALLMIGVGVVLVTVSGAAWRMTAPGHTPCLGLGSSVDLGRCGRRPCSRGGGASHGLLYPEFQHRPPPPSYQASMQEYRLRLLLLDRDRQSGVIRGSSPPPTYRSHAGSLLRAPLTTTSRIGGGGGGGSSIGGSEYSFPPSYRSRNNTATPATICSERSIETAPSGRLLANEDIPEPLNVEQLPEYNTMQYGNNRRRPTATATAIARATTPKTSTETINNELRTSAIVEVEPTVGSKRGTSGVSSGDEKLSPQVSTSKKIKNASSNLSSSTTNGKELVTIVTISQPITEPVSNSSNNFVTTHAACSASDHIEILAHL